MPTKKRHSTRYSGVYYTEGRSSEIRKTERIYYIIYRRNGKQVEKKIGRQIQDKMTPAKAAKIRAEIIQGSQPSRNELRERNTAEKHSVDRFKSQMLEQEQESHKFIEEKWLLFMESATDGFTLYDSELYVLEVNNAQLRMLPEGITKEDLIGKHLTEFAPDTQRTKIYDKFMGVIRTGIPITILDFKPPPKYSKIGLHANIKAFKVGDGLGVILTDVTDLKRTEGELRKREAELEAKNISLQDANIALKVLLEKRDKDREELEEKVIFNMKELAMPILEKLKITKLDHSQIAYLNVLESNLNEIISPFPVGLSSKYINLTPAEIQVANLIRRGETTKEIASLLNSTTRAIEFHRNNVRKKLGLKNKKTNLRTHLLSIHQ